MAEKDREESLALTDTYIQNDQPDGVPPLELTGERTLPDVPEENYWYRRHLAVYEWIAARVAGLTVVDLACGLSEARVVFGHALRNGLIPILTIVGLQFGTLLAGAIVTETIFSWPGLGRLMVEAIYARDYPLVQGCILSVALTYIAVNFVTDFLYAVVDPRVRYD
jgi:hypothetical protein